jgi:hypothetical protein
VRLQRFFIPDLTGFESLTDPLCIYKINRPSHLRRAIGFDLDYLSTSKASPNDTGIVIIIITIICEVVIEHLKVDYSIKLFILNFEIAGSRLK